MSDVQDNPVVEENYYDEPMETVEETQEETEVQTEEVSDSTEEEKPRSGKGDLSVALRKERERVRALTEKLSQTSQGQNQFDPSIVAQLVEQTLQDREDQLKSFEILPELKSNAKLQMMASGLMATGLTKTQAAREVKKLLTGVIEDALSEDAQKASELDKARNAAKTADSGKAPSDKEMADDNYRKKISSPDKYTRQQAVMERIRAKL